jgi:curved DNA-binding protein CbpA
MKDFVDRLNDMFDSLYNSASGRGAPGHDSGDPDLDRAWQDLDSFMGSSGMGSGRSAFSDLDSDFAEFDRKFAAGGKPAADRSFEDFKARAAPQAEAARQERQRTESRANFSGGQQQQRQERPAAEDPLLAKARELVRDYHNLEIKPGAPAEEVKAAYKKLLKQYHPDRFASDPAKQATATQITAKLNQSYARIMDHLAK